MFSLWKQYLLPASFEAKVQLPSDHPFHLYEREHRAEDRLNVILKKAAPGHKQRECDEEDCRHEEDPVEVAVLDAPADLDPEAEEEHREEEKESPEKQDRADVQNRVEDMVDRVLR